MEFCSNKDFEGKISKIPYMTQNLNNSFFEYKLNSKDYIIGLKYDNGYIIISIALKNINNIIIQKFFTYEGIEKFDLEFFKPFNGKILLLFKFITRLLLANLIDFKIIKEDDNNLYYLILNCLKNSSLRPITIDLNDDDDAKEINKDSAPVVENNNKGNKLKINNINKKSNQVYKIELSENEHKYENSKIYKEIEIKFTNIKEKKVYYKYLNFQEIFDLSPYYQLFNCSIEDVFDDLNIIIYHKNYYFEENNQSIKFYFQVFNVRKNSIEPYIFIFIQALERERTDSELQLKMKIYFQNDLSMWQYSEKIENINEQNEEKAIDDNKKIKNQNRNNPQMLYLENFLNMKNQNLNSCNKENKNNSEIKNKNKEQRDINENNKNIIEKNKFENNQIIINEANIKNDSKNFFFCNLIEKDNEKDKNDSFFMNQKRHTDLTIENFFIKGKKNEENKDFNFIKIENNNINKNNNDNKKNMNDIIKKSNNNLIEIEEKKKNKKSNIDKVQKDSKKISKKKSMDFKLDKNGCYNINIDQVTNNYLQLLYVHPLDNDDEIKEIKDEEGKLFYLCIICDTFFKNKNSVREHQWEKHLKPFGDKIQKELKSKNKNESK